MKGHKWITMQELTAAKLNDEKLCVMKIDHMRRKVLVAPTRDKWMRPIYTGVDNMKEYIGKAVYTLCLYLHKKGLIKIDRTEVLCVASIKKWRQDAKVGDQ